MQQLAALHWAADAGLIHYVGPLILVYGIYVHFRELQHTLSAMKEIQQEKESLHQRTENLEANLEVSLSPTSHTASSRALYISSLSSITIISNLWFQLFL